MRTQINNKESYLLYSIIIIYIYIYTFMGLVYTYYDRMQAYWGQPTYCSNVKIRIMDINRINIGRFRPFGWVDCPKQQLNTKVISQGKNDFESNNGIQHYTMLSIYIRRVRACGVCVYIVITVTRLCAIQYVTILICIILYYIYIYIKIS